MQASKSLKATAVSQPKAPAASQPKAPTAIPVTLSLNDCYKLSDEELLKIYEHKIRGISLHKPAQAEVRRDFRIHLCCKSHVTLPWETRI